MLLSLALKNIKERKFRTLLASFSITIGTASMIVFLGLSNGIQQATFSEIEKKSPLTQITVTPTVEKSGVISLLNHSEKGKLTEDTVKQISSISGVKIINPEIQYNNFSSLEIPIFGMTFSTETMVFGVPKDFIKNDLHNPDVWDKNEEPYPALIPRKLLDLYNLTIATPQSLPQLSEDSLIGKELTYYPNYSTFFPSNNYKTDTIRLEVVGFSDKINLIGATLSDQVVQKLNEKYAGEKPDSQKKYLELFVETDNATQTVEIAKKIEALGLNTSYFQKNLQDVDAKFTYLKISLTAISLIIFLTAAIAIISTFLATIAERTKEIGLFRALGATKTHIKTLILIEAGITGLIGSGMGVIIGIIASKIIDNVSLTQLALTTFHPESVFNITPTLILGALFFGTLLSILAGLIPAQKAANISPMVALNRL
ncbi:MAG: ABC transporter permease [Candidatus Peregrinibacteria bacterium]|nr:ABC transporter permease [Candidatus Peregrinibacteria bacterium]